MNTHTRNHLARAALLVILLVLCYRMTINEGIDDGFIGTLSTQLSGLPVAVEIACAAALIMLCSGIGLLVETPRRWPLWAGLFAITGLSVAAFANALAAANHFAALVGACDFSMNLLAGWTIALLCNSANRRALAISVLATLGAALAFKGLYQHYVEIPQTIAQFSHHPNRWLASIGIRPGSPSVRLFISRLKSREVTGFGSDNDQFGEALIPLILLNLMLALTWHDWMLHMPAHGSAAPRKVTRGIARAQKTEVNSTQNTLIIGSVFAGIVLLAEFCVLYFTGEQRINSRHRIVRRCPAGGAGWSKIRPASAAQIVLAVGFIRCDWCQCLGGLWGCLSWFTDERPAVSLAILEWSDGDHRPSLLAWRGP